MGSGESSGEGEDDGLIAWKRCSFLAGVTGRSDGDEGHAGCVVSQGVWRGRVSGKKRGQAIVGGERLDDVCRRLCGQG